jgi:periplasmic protein TonB
MKKNNNLFYGLAIISCMCMAVLSCNQGDYNTDTSTITVETQATDTTAPMMVTDTATTKSSDTAVKAVSTAKTKKGKVSSTMMAMEPKNAQMNMDKSGFYNNVEVLPMFPGGQSALDNFINNNIEYPETATDNAIEGVVRVNFAVDEKGKLYNPKIVGKPLGYGLEDAVIKAVNKMPMWTPGAIKGKNVKTYYTLPVNFKFEN